VLREASLFSFQILERGVNIESIVSSGWEDNIRIELMETEREVVD